MPDNENWLLLSVGDAQCTQRAQPKLVKRVTPHSNQLDIPNQWQHICSSLAGWHSQAQPAQQGTSYENDKQACLVSSGHPTLPGQTTSRV